VALVAVMVWIGIYPSTFFDKIEEPVNYIVRQVDPNYFGNAVVPAAGPAASRRPTGSEALPGQPAKTPALQQAAK